jgi:hypothetical protein
MTSLVQLKSVLRWVVIVEALLWPRIRAFDSECYGSRRLSSASEQTEKQNPNLKGLRFRVVSQLRGLLLDNSRDNLTQILLWQLK